MRVQGVLVCAILVMVAGNAAAAVTGSTPSRGSNWVHWSRPSAFAARPLPAGGAARGTDAARLGRDRKPEPSGSVIAWTGGGVQVCDTESNQFNYRLTAGASGSVIVAWSDDRTASYDVYAMRLDANGNRTWPAGGVALCANDSLMILSEVVPDGAGGAFAVMGQATEAAFSDMITQHVTALGTIASGWPTNGRSTAPAGSFGGGAIPTNDGFLLMGWIDLNGQLRAQRLTGVGGLASGWSAPGLAIGRPQNQGDVKVAPDGAGGGYLAWAQNDSVMLTRVAPGGGFAPGWSAAGTLVRSVTFTGQKIALAPLTGGEIMVFWTDIRSLSEVDIYCAHYTGAGTLASGWPAGGLPANAGLGDQNEPQAVSDGADGAVVLWRVDPDGVFAQRVTGSGAFFAGWPATGVTLCTTPGKNLSEPVSDGAGGALFAWDAHDQFFEDAIYAQRVDATGAIPSGWPTAGQTVCAETGPQYDPRIATDGSGGMIVVWADVRDLSFQRVYAARVQSDGTVGALAALVSASAEPGLARLHWFSPDGASFEARLERAEGGGGFVSLGRVHADGVGHVRYEDHDVMAGSTYRYRLAVDEDGTTHYLGEVTLRVPDGSRLALAGFYPNPAAGAPMLAYTLATSAPARIEVLDTAGRRVMARELDSAPGEHVVAFDGARLGPGVYLLRLTQGSRSVTTRAALVR